MTQSELEKPRFNFLQTQKHRWNNCQQERKEHIKIR